MITISPDAVQKIKDMIAQANPGTDIPETAGLRLYVIGGLRHGLKHGLKLESIPKHGDTVTESHGVRIFIDPISISYSKGIVIYVLGNRIAYEIPLANIKPDCNS